MRYSLILTSEQARILYDLAKAKRSAIVEQWKFGIWDGLLQSLAHIDRAGGAHLHGRLSAIERGGDIIETAIIPAHTYIAWLSVKTVPGPYWDLVAMLPELTVDHLGQTLVWLPVSIYRTTNPLAIIPLAAATLPADKPLQGVSPNSKDPPAQRR